MKATIVLIFKNLIGMMMTKTMILWGLRFAVKQTDNKLDDNAALFIEGAYENDPSKIKEAIERITEELESR